MASENSAAATAEQFSVDKQRRWLYDDDDSWMRYWISLLSADRSPTIIFPFFSTHQNSEFFSRIRKMVVRRDILAALRPWTENLYSTQHHITMNLDDGEKKKCLNWNSRIFTATTATTQLLHTRSYVLRLSSKNLSILVLFLLIVRHKWTQNKITRVANANELNTGKITILKVLNRQPVEICKIRVESHSTRYQLSTRHT